MSKPDITKRCYHCGKESETDDDLQKHLDEHREERRGSKNSEDKE